MSKNQRLATRRPATKFAKLQKKIKKQKVQGNKERTKQEWRSTRAGF